MRIGQGFDAHRFAPGTRLVLGGVEIPHDQGLEAHSDGDVLLHAITDAVLGAAGLGDLGKHFPDTDQAFAGIDSRLLLRDAVEKAAAAGWRLVNVDATVIAQQPRLAPHVPAMRAHIAADLRLAQGAVNLKATTTEHMGFTGRGEGIAALAVVLLEAR
ncbi:2-C-methyl-D-erythritol 2,4-cyclodiphosphate synthase [Alkalilimnicola sp. S0819]|uniref:2-C-methyl-D-erythritol 2,4-cyclodiphosphate synthase n=1 Tax=Alkalilimnicola sp. S0819 TaxID=2613922 RepID=UPI0012621EBA|nr:2-C-methyl-D-erythritol 2,4-cyclodiphosphate synthase [Alkalilimnicola sp. S0819]KAB7627943.1 2-C-methyl-D-erythritol 2,4-cyclodiphosphate synthase [Alkalilimnicola sp. S0819]MPQ15581.1 2-C-methyl-D-erythritol 2,4-cyclodiphosphate synthase [Alkalilimnicola sp. S0819]